MFLRKPITFLSAFLMLSAPSFAHAGTKSAAEVYNELHVQGVTFGSQPTKVENGYDSNGGIVTYGAEKEGTDFGIANVMGPTAGGFKKFVKSLGVGKKNSKEFTKAFLKGLASGEFRQNVVKDVHGVAKKINYDFLNGVNLDEKHSHELSELLDKWLEQTGDKPFAFIKAPVRIQILEGQFAGNNPKTARKVLAGDYRSWTPLFGTPEKYISEAEPAADYIHRMSGWEILFKVQKSYGEYEKFLGWFSEAMKDNPKNKAPGHQRLVWPMMNLTPEAKEEMDAKTAEMYKNFQAYIILRGIAGNTGIMTSKWKNILKDKELANLQTWKGVLRAEHGRWPNGSRKGYGDWKSTNGGIEFRAGTKDVEVQRFFEKTLVARVASNDWGKVQRVDSWKLVPESLDTLDGFIRIFSQEKALEKIAARFDVPKSEVRKFFHVIKGKYKEMEVGRDRRIDVSYLVPLWYWENAPYLSPKKKEIIKSLSKDLIHFVATNGNKLDFDQMNEAIQKWTQTAAIDRDIEYYLAPQYNVADNSEEVHEFRGSNNGKVVDVNTIDLGIEYTGRMPIKDFGIFTDGEDQTGKKEWVNSKLGLSPIERDAVIKGLAKSLSLNVGNGPEVQPELVVPPKKEEDKNKKEQNHGHGISLSYKFKDPKGGEWRVEWDGIGRTYDANGKVVEGSTRGGHIELVTPRFKPTSKEINAVFKSFEQNSVIPSVDAGGGHVNVDLAPFKGKPEAMARFLTLFHKYRGTSAMIFQSPKRLKSAEPARVSPELHEQLKNFKGTEAELKALLYNKKYFNNRVGRKTRYMQNDIACYFQEVIPEKYISQDFDINNPTVLWRQQFRVKPKIRKMEFRMMDAPRTAHESAMMIKFVRALLSKALNETTPIEGDVQEVDHVKYANNPAKAFEDLKKMTDELGLSYDDYKGYMGDAISNVQVYMKSKLFKTLDERVKLNPRLDEENDWGVAVVPAREEGDLNGPSCEDRKWEATGLEPHPLAVQSKERRIAGAKKADGIRAKKSGESRKSETEKPCFMRRISNFGIPLEKIIELSQGANKVVGE